MTEFEYNMNQEIDIANWEDEGGASKSQHYSFPKHNALMICLGLIVALPLFYLVVRKR